VRTESSGDPEIVRVTVQTLSDGAVLDTVAGQAAVELARSVPNAGDSAKAGLVKELRAVMAEAMQGAKRATDPLDELGARRAAKLHTG
jgi:hypothetical protein